MKPPRLLLPAFVALFSLPSAAEARRPMGTTMTGVVKRVHHLTRWIVLAQDNGTERVFVYTTQAMLWSGSQSRKPSALRQGMRVQVNLHQPLIGPDFVRQIKVIDQADKRVLPEGRKH